jgi:hypothetical protein
MSNLDRAIGLIIVLAIIAMYYFNVIGGGLAIGLGIVALIFALTSLVNFCPLYKVLGISSHK